MQCKADAAALALAKVLECCFRRVTISAASARCESNFPPNGFQTASMSSDLCSLVDGEYKEGHRGSLRQ